MTNIVRLLARVLVPLRASHTRRIIIGALACAPTLVAGADPTGWGVLREYPAEHAAWVRPAQGLIISIDPNAMDRALANVALEGPGAAATTIQLLDPTGRTRRFEVVESPIMEPALAAAHPDVRTFVGHEAHRPECTLRLTRSPLGINAFVLDASDDADVDATWLIDPASRDDSTIHTAYFRRDAGADPRTLKCLTAPGGVVLPAAESGPGPIRREYRLAMATTGEFTTWAGSTSAAFSLVVSATSQLNAIYERELGIRFVLVASNSAIIFPSAATDPFANPADPAATNAALATTLDQIVGPYAFDIGHVLHRVTSASLNNGLAGGIGTVCSSIKGQGYTAYTTPNDAYFVSDYLAHEIGHQCGAHHPFNSCSGIGGDEAQYLVEPGSGSTIMSYAGICGATNLQVHSDPYFNSINLEQMNNYLLSGGLCAQTVFTGNNQPIVSAGNSFNIPARTPFELTASASDPDGDSVTLCWEQVDGSNPVYYPPVVSEPGYGPLVRSKSPVISPMRSVPLLSTVLAGATDPQEFLPRHSRTMHWRATARDNRAGAGQSAFSEVALSVIDSGAAFAVTGPGAGTYSGNVTVTWDPANTSAPPISAQQVRILLSTDGGLTFPTVLSESALNDGTEDVTLPNVNSGTCRIRIEALNNIFYAVSPANFTVFPAADSVFTILTDGGEGIAWDVNADGTVVVGWREQGSSSNVAAFRWVRGQGNSTIVSAFASATGVSADGSRVVGYLRNHTIGGEYGWRWNAQTGHETLPFPILNAPVQSGVTAISADGTTSVGNREFANGNPRRQACKWVGSTVTLLGSMYNGLNTYAHNVNDDGSVIVGDGTIQGSQRRAFRWTESTGFVNLGVLPGQGGSDTSVNSFSLACSDDGDVIVGYSGSRAFRWTQESGMVDIGSLPGTTITEAYDVSADGRVIIGRSIGNPQLQGPQSFVWREGQAMRNLSDIIRERLGRDFGNWYFTAQAISADGTTVVGSAYDGSSLTYPFVAVIADPCPADFDANGGIDGGDLAAYFAAFEAGDASADVDFNGGVDGGDLASFFSMFEAGGC